MLLKWCCYSTAKNFKSSIKQFLKFRKSNIFSSKVNPIITIEAIVQTKSYQNSSPVELNTKSMECTLGDRTRLEYKII